MDNLFTPSYIYLWKVWFLLFFDNVFLFLHDFMQLLYSVLKAFTILFIGRIYTCFFVFLCNPENLSMICLIKSLFYDIYNTISEDNQIWNNYLYLMILSLLQICKEVIEKVFITSFALSLIMTSLLSLFECIECSSSLSLEEIKVIATVNWIIHVPDFLRSFIMPFKYGLI